MFLGNGGSCFSLFVLLLQVQNRLYLAVGLFAVLCVLESGRWPVDVVPHLGEELHLIAAKAVLLGG